MARFPGVVVCGMKDGPALLLRNTLNGHAGRTLASFRSQHQRHLPAFAVAREGEQFYDERMGAILDRQLLELDSAAEWEQWIESNSSHDGVRLRVRKKNTKLPGVTYSDALDIALCHGWIDGQSGSLDADYYSVAFSPRRARSPWSQVNRENVERLIADARMRPAGLAEIDRAKADGRWDAAYRQKDAVVPADLQAALDASPAATTCFATLSAQNRWAILLRLGEVKRAETRERKIATYRDMLARGETLYPQIRPQKRAPDDNSG